MSRITLYQAGIYVDGSPVDNIREAERWAKESGHTVVAAEYANSGQYLIGLTPAEEKEVEEKGLIQWGGWVGSFRWRITVERD